MDELIRLLGPERNSFIKAAEVYPGHDGGGRTFYWTLCLYLKNCRKLKPTPTQKNV